MFRGSFSPIFLLPRCWFRALPHDEPGYVLLVWGRSGNRACFVCRAESEGRGAEGTFDGATGGEEGGGWQRVFL